MTPPNIDQIFDYDTISQRNAEFLMSYIQLALPGPGERSSSVVAAVLGSIPQSLADQAMLLAETKRLYDVLEGLKRRHMPLAGEPGAPVLCTGCSLHGAQIPWPCETYQGADRALPERRP